ncbi:MAG: SdrD B-like domain-containing protein [Saprospiraceae bacterium]|nr:SdrD B-like domain-containing protein [Saprospiraceae bacterium]
MRKATFTLARPVVGLTIALVCFVTFNVFGQQQFDVALTKTTVTSAPVKYGTAIPFNFTIYNQGLDTITNVEVIDHFGSGYEFQGGLNLGWAEHPTIVNAVTTTFTEKIPPNENRIVTLNLVVRPGDSFDDWQNTGEVITFTDVNGIDRESEDMDSQGNENPSDDAGGLLGSPADNYIDGNGTGTPNDGVAATDEDDHDRDSIQVFDLAITKILDPTTGYTYGDTLTFDITVYNQGNTLARIVRVRDILPEGYINPIAENVANGWSNDPVNPIYTIDSINPFESVDISIQLVLGTTYFDENAWTNYSEIFSARDKDLVNVSALDADSNPASNTEGERSVKPGDPDDNNIGNTSVNPDDEDDHDPAAPVVFDLALIKERATALSSFNYGTPIEYTYTVQNQGNVDATNIVLYDSLPCGALFEQALNPGWSYDPGTRIATRTIPSLDAATEIQGMLTLTVIPCTIDQATAWTNYMEISSATTAAGVQTVEIDGVFDENLSNDPGGIPETASDNALDGDGIFDEDNHDVELLQVYDLALKKELITPGPYFEGQELDFRIRVYNQGNIVIEDLILEDFVPEGYGYDPVVNAPLGWTNSYQTLVTGVLTTFPDTLNVMEDIFLATEDSIDIFIKLNLELDGEDISDWYNYAHIWVATDTVGNNRFDDADSNPFMTSALEFAVVPGSDEDDDIFSPGKSVTPQVEEDDHDVANLSYFDLALEKNLPSTLPTTYNENVTFEIVVRNEGVQFAHDITVVDYLPCGYGFDPDDNTGWALNVVTGNPEYFYTDTLYAGEEVSIPITLRLVECLNPDANSWRNIAEIKDALDDSDTTGDDQDSTPDDSSFNEPNGEDDVDDARIDVFDLALSKIVINPITIYEVGNDVMYEIEITNQGNLVANNIDVIDYIPCGMVLSAASSGWTVDLDGYANTTIAGPLNPGASTSVFITLTIEDCAVETGLRNNIAEIREANDPSNMPSGDFDSTPDNIPDNDVPGEDDIDNVEVPVQFGGRIGDFVFNDYDGDGIQDGGEPGIPNVMVVLYDEFDNVIAATDTDGSGLYEFLDVPPGNYYVVFTIDDDSLSPTIPNAGNNANDSNITDENGIGSTAIFPLAAGQNEETIDAGYFQCLDIKGVTYYDVNEDDIRQLTENGINGLVANLYRRVNGVWILWDSETTHHDYDTPSDDGIWDFCVPPGTYYMEIQMPPIGLVRVRPFVGGSNFDSDINGANGPNTTPTFTLNPGGSKTNLGAGYYPMATVGNRVWYDENANGIQEDFEEKAEGVNVQVYNMNNELVDEATTDEEGIYEVDYLQKEEYYLRFVAPEGMNFTFADASEDEDKDSDVTHAMGINTTDPISFKPGDKIIHIDAGIISGVLPLVWKDFYVEENEDHHLLTWITSMEVNVDRFEIERRLAGESEFKVLDKITAAGNTSKDHSYSFRDSDVSLAGDYYYRINQIDLDGKNSYSKIQHVKRNGELGYSIFPNPTSGKLNISGEFDPDENYVIRIYDNLGREIERSTKWSDAIDLTFYSNGLYTIVIELNNEVIHTRRIAKQ